MDSKPCNTGFNPLISVSIQPCTADLLRTESCKRDRIPSLLWRKMEKDKTKICGYKTFYKAGTCGITSSFMTLVVTGQSFSLTKSSKVVVCRSRYVSEFTFRGRFSDIPSLIKLAAVHQIMFAYRRIFRGGRNR